MTDAILPRGAAIWLRGSPTLTFYRVPRQHHKHLKSTNMLERLNEEIRRRTHVVRIFPNGKSCLRRLRRIGTV